MRAVALEHWRTVPRAWRRAVLATGALWLITLVIVVVAAGTLPALDPVGVSPMPGFGGWSPPPTDAAGFALLRTALVRFDALWYLAIARDGYPLTAEVPQAAAFFPGYPLLVRGLAIPLGGSQVLGAAVASNFATVAAFAGIHRLAEQLAAATGWGADDGSHDGDALGRRAVLTLAIFPTSFFLVAPYSESLFLAATVWALVFASRGAWISATACAVVVGVTRPVGLLLALPLVVGFGPLHDCAPRDRWRMWAGCRLAPTVGLGAGLATVLGAGWLRWGTPLAPMDAQAGWQREWTWPWESVDGAFSFALRDAGAGTTGYHLLDLLVVVAAVTAIGVLAWRGRRNRMALVLAAHGLANVLVWLVQPFPGRPLLSASRFALVVPAVVLGLAVATERPTNERIWTAASVVLLSVHLLLFSRWWYVF